MPNFADTSQYTPQERALWEALKEHEREPFATVKGLRYTYTIIGNELFVDRRGKSITRASVNLAYQRVVELEGKVNGPKSLGVFGASYLYPIFLRLGVITEAEAGQEK